MKQTVYIETTIVSYLTAWPSRDVLRLSHEVMTRDWWTNERHRFELRTSQMVVQEAAAGDPTAAAERLKALAGISDLAVTPAVVALAKHVAHTLKLPRRVEADAVHLALAAVHNVDVLLTWNCTHIANGSLIPRIQRACGEHGFAAPQLLTPEQLMEQP